MWAFHFARHTTAAGLWKKAENIDRLVEILLDGVFNMLQKLVKELPTDVRFPPISEFR
jgi:hypothetical protein